MRDLLRTNRSPVFGVLIAPSAPLFALLIANLVLTGQITDPVHGAYLVFPVSYPISLVVGVPVLYIFTVLKKNQLWHYIAGGALASLIPIVFLLIKPFMDIGFFPLASGHRSIPRLL